MINTDTLPTLNDDDRHCAHCLRVKHHSMFGIRNGKPDTFCKPCRTAANREYQRKNRSTGNGGQQLKAWNLWRQYGLREEDYEALRKHQDYRCGICGSHEDEIPERVMGRPRIDGTRGIAVKLSIDHQHESGQVRGLLCMDCNHLVGRAKDDPARFDAAAAYLRRPASALPFVQRRPAMATEKIRKAAPVQPNFSPTRDRRPA